MFNYFVGFQAFFLQRVQRRRKNNRFSLLIPRDSWRSRTQKEKLLPMQAKKKINEKISILIKRRKMKIFERHAQKKVKRNNFIDFSHLFGNEIE